MLYISSSFTYNRHHLQGSIYC